MWKTTILTLFPDMFPGPLGHALSGNALKNKVWSLETVNLRDFSKTNYKNVDDTPYGGGPGMVIRPDIVEKTILSVQAARLSTNTENESVPFIYLTPRGQPLNQQFVKTIASGPGAVILCGRYEGIDQRVIDHFDFIEVSVGDYILSGGEIAAYNFIDACVRLLPGVMGCNASMIEESFENNLLEYPQYTRPDMWNGKNVPDVLLSGNHKEIEKWRRLEAEEITRKRRPDLWEKYHNHLQSKKG